MRRIRYLRLTGRQRRWVWLWLTVLLVTGLCCAAVLHMRPIIVSLATARVSNAVNRIVVDAVRDAIDSGQVNYDVLIHLEKDETGRVAALESNMAAFNRLRSQIADEILRRLSEVSTSELSIPVGTLTGSTLLAGRGPCIRVRMQAVGSADASLRNAFPPPASTRLGTRSCCMWTYTPAFFCRASPPPPRSATRSPWRRPSLWAACRRHTPISAPLPRSRSSTPRTTS